MHLGKLFVDGLHHPARPTAIAVKICHYWQARIGCMVFQQLVELLLVLNVTHQRPAQGRHYDETHPEMGMK